MYVCNVEECLEKCLTFVFLVLCDLKSTAFLMHAIFMRLGEGDGESEFSSIFLVKMKLDPCLVNMEIKLFLSKELFGFACELSWLLTMIVLKPAKIVYN